MRPCEPIKILRGAGTTQLGTERCLLGFSVGGLGDDAAPTAAAWAWVISRYEEGAILIGDSLQRLTIQIQRGIPPDHAERAAQFGGEAAQRELSAALGPHAAFIRTSSIAREEKFSERFRSFANAYSKLGPFQDSIDSDAASFCARQSRKGLLAVGSIRAHELSVLYLLEEVTIYDLLADRGWSTEAYLGPELGTLARFITGQITGLSPSLEGRVHIRLRVEKRKEPSCCNG